MIEELLEDIAQNNHMRNVNTYLKLSAGLGAIILCLVSSNSIPPLFIAVTLSLSLILLARIPPRSFFMVIIGPLLFSMVSILAIILLTGGGDVFWSWTPVPWLSLSVTGEGLRSGAFIFCRVLGGMTALVFIAMTTPMTDLFVVMRSWRVPESVVDLAMIIYRTIFLIMDQLVVIYQAQVMRLGYGSFRESITSFSTLCGSVFIASWDSGEDLIKAMDARCYIGKFAILGEIRPVEPRALMGVVGFLAVSTFVVVVTGNFFPNTGAL